MPILFQPGGRMTESGAASCKLIPLAEGGSGVSFAASFVSDDDAEAFAEWWTIAGERAFTEGVGKQVKWSTGA